jgi:hypothetical protein
MATLEEVKPIDRFDNLSFSSEVVDGAAFPLHPRYKCPRCGETISFEERHFEERAARRHTNLPSEVASRLSEWGKERGFENSPFLDWLPGLSAMRPGVCQALGWREAWGSWR